MADSLTKRRVRDVYLIPVLAVLLLAGSSAILLNTFHSLSDLSDRAIVSDTREFARSVAEFRNFYTRQIVPRGRQAGMPITHDYLRQEAALPLPATFAKDFGEYLGSQEGGTRVKLYSDLPFPWRQDKHSLDEFELDALAMLRRNPARAVWRFETIEGERYLRFARADVLKESCIGCHNSYPGTPKTDWRVGDIRGVLEVIRPVASIQADTRSSLWDSFLLMVAITLSALLLVWQVIRRLRGSLDQTEALVEETAVINANLEKEIEDRRLAEHSLTLSDAKNRAVVDGVVDGIVVIDERGTVVQFNQAAADVFGYEPDEVVGQNVAILMEDPYRSAHDEYLARYVRTGRKTIIGSTREVEGKRKDGELFPLELAVSEIKVGDIRLFSGIVRDITERKQFETDLANARDAAVESARLKSDFLATMSHEIRTPMNGIIGTAGLLRDTHLDTEQLQLVDTLRHSSESLLSIINDILDFSKIEAGKLEFEHLEFELHGAVEGTLDLLAERAASKGLELASFIDRNVPYRLYGDPGRLRQVLTNLVGNAIKFTESGHVITRIREVSREADISVLGFEIEDTGIGIADEAKPRLFQSFSQVDSSMSRRFGGTGLGLAISRQLVEQMGGEIGVDSVPGKGATFWFRVQLNVARDNRRGIEPLPDVLPSRRILLLEQNGGVAAALKGQLEQLHADVSVLENGHTVLSELRKAMDEGDAFGALVLNQSYADTQGMTAAALAAEIAGTLGDQAPRCLLLTSMDVRIAKRDDIEPGIDAYLHKPVKQGLLRDMLYRLLGRQVTKGPLSDDGDHIHELTVEAEAAPDVSNEVMFNHLRLLLVEDNKVNQMVAIGHLRKLGFNNVDAVGNGREAVEAQARAPYDLILMDWQMPEMDGFEATRAIRAAEQGTDVHVPVIAMTASAMKGDREACEAAGMDDYVSKPLDRDRLGEVLARWSEKVQ